MNSIRVKNLRSLKDTKTVELKKINLFVGNNSSGKSTLLRVFPLFKQSFQKKINGPILWGGGDEDYVDFGSFAESLNYGTQQDTIRFIFNMDMNDSFAYNYPSQKGHQQNTNLEIAIKSDGNNRLDYISELSYDYCSHRISIGFNFEKKITFFKVDDDDMDITEIYGKEQNMWFWETNSLFDISVQPIRGLVRNKIAECLEIDIKIKDSSANLDTNIRLLDNCMNTIFVNDILGERLSGERLSGERLLSVTAIIKAAADKGKMDEAKKWVLRYFALNFMGSISEYLHAFFKKVYYITPVRATAERYYTLRNYSVDEVDCRGKNLPIFLNSLNKDDFKKFQNWTLKNLGFQIMTAPSEGHVSLKVGRGGQSKSVNLSDAGFGYSQILPIVIQLWYLTYKKRSEDSLFWSFIDVPITIAIEQPELHLHPGFQAKLADIIATIAKEKNVRFIIETHSETIINRIGTLIEKKRISNNDVGIYIFDKRLGEDETTVHKSSYDKDGYLINWPVGFFEPEEV